MFQRSGAAHTAHEYNGDIERCAICFQRLADCGVEFGAGAGEGECARERSRGDRSATAGARRELRERVAQRAQSRAALSAPRALHAGAERVRRRRRCGALRRRTCADRWRALRRRRGRRQVIRSSSGPRWPPAYAALSHNRHYQRKDRYSITVHSSALTCPVEFSVRIIS